MSRQYEEVKQRLEKAKSDVRWLLAVLDDPQSAFAAYDLTEEEIDQLFDNAQTAWKSIGEVLQRLQNLPTGVKLGSQTIFLDGPIPPSLRAKLDVTGSMLGLEPPTWTTLDLPIEPYIGELPVRKPRPKIQSPTDGELPIRKVRMIEVPLDEISLWAGPNVDENSIQTWRDVGNLLQGKLGSE